MRSAAPAGDRVTEYIKAQIVGHPNIQSYVAGPNALPRGAASHFDWLSATTFPSAEDHRTQQNDPVRQKKTAVEFLPYADILNFDCLG